MFANVNKSNAEYTKDKSNDEDNEDSHSAEEEQNTKDSESVKTPPVKKRALFNAMAILNGDRKKCLDEIGFGSMTGMGIHELPGKLEYLWVDVH
nr:hypothetical protein [Tanacetum cinerariifolium]